MSLKIELMSLIIGRSTLFSGFKNLVPPSPQVRKRKLLTEFRRSEILDAATRVFGDKGYDETRMDDVAAAANLAKATVYAYFDSKDEIFAAVVERCLDELAALTGPRVEAAYGFARKLEVFVATRLEYWSERLALYRVIVTLKRESRDLKRSLRWQRHAIDFLLTLFEAAATHGDIPRGDFESSAWALMDILRGQLERRMAHPGRSLEQDTATLTAFMLHALQYRCADAPSAAKNLRK